MPSNRTISKRKQDEENRLSIVAELYRKGYSYRQIQKEVKARLNKACYSMATITQDVHKLLDEWREKRQIDIDEEMTIELARIDHIIKEAWEAWEKSKNPSTGKTRTIKGAKQGGGDEGSSASVEKIADLVVRVREDSENGDPRYLTIINSALIERRKLLGLYDSESKKVAIKKEGDKFTFTFE